MHFFLLILYLNAITVLHVHLNKEKKENIMIVNKSMGSCLEKYIFWGPLTKKMCKVVLR